MYNVRIYSGIIGMRLDCGIFFENNNMFVQPYNNNNNNNVKNLAEYNVVRVRVIIHVRVQYYSLH